MGYAVQADLETRFTTAEIVQLTDVADPPTGLIDAAKVAAALAAADALIDAYVGVKYALPLAEVPAVLTDKAADIARFELYGHGATAEVKARYDDAVAFLRDLSLGKAKLKLADGAEAATPAGTIAHDGPERTFGRTRTEGF